jgi:hypothetical protein
LLLFNTFLCSSTWTCNLWSFSGKAVSCPGMYTKSYWTSSTEGWQHSLLLDWILIGILLFIRLPYCVLIRSYWTNLLVPKLKSDVAVY